MGPILVNIFINGLEVGLEGILSKFVDETKLGGAAIAQGRCPQGFVDVVCMKGECVSAVCVQRTSGCT